MRSCQRVVRRVGGQVDGAGFRCIAHDRAAHDEFQPEAFGEQGAVLGDVFVNACSHGAKASESDPDLTHGLCLADAMPGVERHGRCDSKSTHPEIHCTLMLDIPQAMRHRVPMPTRNYFTNGVPEMLVLRLLSRQEMYGYQLVAAIRERSAETFQFGEGCLYPILHRLAGESHLTTRREVVEGRARHYYKISSKGLRHLERLTREWTSVVRGTQSIMEAARILKPTCKPFEPPSCGAASLADPSQNSRKNWRIITRPPKRTSWRAGTMKPPLRLWPSPRWGSPRWWQPARRIRCRNFAGQRDIRTLFSLVFAFCALACNATVLACVVQVANALKGAHSDHRVDWLAAEAGVSALNWLTPMAGGGFLFWMARRFPAGWKTLIPASAALALAVSAVGVWYIPHFAPGYGPTDHHVTIVLCDSPVASLVLLCAGEAGDFRRSFHDWSKYETLLCLGRLLLPVVATFGLRYMIAARTVNPRSSTPPGAII